MPTLSTYIQFPGNAREAFACYQSIFGGELQLETYGDMPDADFPFTPQTERVAWAQLSMPSGVISGGDDPVGGQPLVSESLSLLYSASDADQARKIIAAFLEKGATEEMPFEIAPWGSWYGQIVDPFGVRWAFDATI
ncbi:VOC family protein [Corynebacterium felinum]|uniref:PhnB protein n=1 Tax=Corynebacterium felinum TaxID=131318 RepID=A0ABU2B9K2_9CORY|nr:VOC family protein [Corynebacterium felinum]MDF5820820.1 VOC family protein [Corynebacterium felinum]MDR7354064.1 PhnB protein [Corynebacterium felinum]WJY96236.1 hypothetical protein CFELI_13285 [Corynebacterium felinum]